MRAASEVQCLVLTRADVIRLIGNLQDIYPNRPAEAQLSVPSGVNDQDPDISLANLAVMSILGEGGFGKVYFITWLLPNRKLGRIGQSSKAESILRPETRSQDKNQQKGHKSDHLV